MRSSGKGSSVSKVARANAVTGPISTKRVSRTTLRARRRVWRPGSVRVQPVGGLGELQGEALAQKQEAVEKAVRQLDVVVDHQQPVVARGRVFGEQQVEVLELPPPAWLTGVQLDVVAGAHELRAHRAGERVVLGSLDAEHEHSSPRRAVARGQLETQPRPLVSSQAVRQPRPPTPGARRPAPPRSRSFPTGNRRRRSRRPRSRLTKPPAVRAFAHALPQAARAVGDHRQPARAATADDVSRAAGEREQLAPERGRPPAADVEAASRTSARVSGASQGSRAAHRRRARRWSTAARATYRTSGPWFPMGNPAPHRRLRRRTDGPATPARRRHARASRRTGRHARGRCGVWPCWRPTRTAPGCHCHRGPAR